MARNVTHANAQLVARAASLPWGNPPLSTRERPQRGLIPVKTCETCSSRAAKDPSSLARLLEAWRSQGRG